MRWWAYVLRGGTGSRLSKDNRTRVRNDQIYPWKITAKIVSATGLLVVSVGKACAAVEGLPTAPDWVSVVQNVGFPMSIASVCLWVIVVTLKEFGKDIRDLTKAFYENSKVLTGIQGAVESNTRAIQSQTDTIRRVELLLYTGRDTPR